MADSGQGNSREFLTEREREALEILAREIVREAGLCSDPDEEAEKERMEELIDARERNLQAFIEYCKHMTTLSAASIVAGISVIGALVNDATTPNLAYYLAYISLGVIAIALLSAVSAYARFNPVVGRRTLRGGFLLRDKTLDELVVERRRTAATMMFISAVIAAFWILGFYGLIAAITALLA